MTTGAKNTDQVIVRGISMKPAHYRALARLAVAAGHMSRSRVVQELIDAAMTKREGPDWEEREEAAA